MNLYFCPVLANSFLFHIVLCQLWLDERKKKGKQWFSTNSLYEAQFDKQQMKLTFGCEIFFFLYTKNYCTLLLFTGR